MITLGLNYSQMHDSSTSRLPGFVGPAISEWPRFYPLGAREASEECQIQPNCNMEASASLETLMSEA